MTRILIADDEESVREVIKDILQDEGYELLESSDGGSTCIVAASERPDLIVLDLTMPRVSGLEAIRKLKEDPVTRAIPVLVLTGRLSPKYETEAMRLGAMDFITKPFTADELKDRIRLGLAQ